MAESTPSSDFIREAVRQDLAEGRFQRVQTRFPPEPNGYMHIGHTKGFALSFGIAEEFGGFCSLRFDDTNPTREETEYVEAIQRDIHWMGFDWGEHLYFASEYFDQLYEMAEDLIKKGKAYVCDLSADEVREYRGTLTEPGRNSPYRDRSVEENLDLFRRMRAGEFPEGSRTLRTKIDMASPNINLRDPVMYRILYAHHHRTGDKWCIYPMYDFAHGQSDSIEGVTHSICDQDYEAHRPLYDWYLDALGIYHPRQIEYARLYLNYTILSKRYLRRLVEEHYVSGWDDPRMPTLAGMRRKGYPAEAIRAFLTKIGVSKANSIVDVALLEHCVRERLNAIAPRRMAALRPLKVVLDNYPDDLVEHMQAINNPEDASIGTRQVPFSKTLYIEQEDFMENPPAKYYRLAPGREVRLRYAYFIRCERVVKDPATGQVVELHCTYDPATRGGDAPDGRKVKATLHWVSAAHAIPAQVRLYDRLFLREDPMEGGDFATNLNPNSLQVLGGCQLEPSLAEATPGQTFQFERLGYFCMDPDSAAGQAVFNRTESLRDTWAKVQSAG